LWRTLTQHPCGGACHAPCAVGLRPTARRTEDTMKFPPKQSPQQLLRLQANAASMRRAPTASERALWQRLKGRQLGVQFRRQVIWGSFILDFFASSVRLVVEVDGGYHAERRAADARRDGKLRRAGLRVVRVSAEVIMADVERAVEVVRVDIAGTLR
jgi:crossover junction endodeoxyribonuclease RuvC